MIMDTFRTTTMTTMKLKTRRQLLFAERMLNDILVVVRQWAISRLVLGRKGRMSLILGFHFLMLLMLVTELKTFS